MVLLENENGKDAHAYPISEQDKMRTFPKKCSINSIYD